MVGYGGKLILGGKFDVVRGYGSFVDFYKWVLCRVLCILYYCFLILWCIFHFSDIWDSVVIIYVICSVSFNVPPIFCDWLMSDWEKCIENGYRENHVKIWLFFSWVVIFWFLGCEFFKYGMWDLERK